MLDADQLVDLVIVPACESLGAYSENAVALLLATAMHESRLTYIKQVGGGPALGLWQMEPATHDDIYANYLTYRPHLVEPLVGRTPEELIHNIFYACQMARLHYMRIPEALPSANDLTAQAEYWKKHYNTYQGKGTVEKFIADAREIPQRLRGMV